MLFLTKQYKHIDYKDIELLKKFIGPQGNLWAKRKLVSLPSPQRQLATAVKRARFMGLLPYIAR